MSFVHLHVHTGYSLLDGAIKIDDLVTAVKEHGMPAVAITDHGNMYGALEFYKKAKENGIKPIIGCEIYVTPYSIRNSEIRTKRNKEDDEERNYHLTLLATNYEGYKNLLKIISIAHLEGFYYKPCVDKEILTTYAEGIVALSGCLKGELAQNILKNNFDKAKSIAEQYIDIFDRENFYIELQANGLPEQAEVNQKLIELARFMGLKVIATNDCHYLRKEHAEAHDVLLCIQTGRTVLDSNRMKFNTNDLYLKSPEEMFHAFRHIPEAVKNTLEIEDKCNIEIPTGKYVFPEFPLEGEKTVEEEFEQLAIEGLQKRWESIRRKFPEPQWDKWWQIYEKRLVHEIAVIKKTGFAPYFLIVADFIRYAKSRNIPVGPGRGSAAGSLAAYALNITDIDPIEHGLLFERFLNEERISMPDIDVDFCQKRREEVLQYVTQKYGKERVAHITTFGTMQARQAIRDVGRALGLPYSEVDEIAKLIPNSAGMTIKKALELDPALREIKSKNPQYEKLFDIAMTLEGLARHASTHAAGIVIADRPINEYVPLYKDQDDNIVTQYSMKYIEEVGLIKFDFLGLRNLTVINETLEIIKQNRGVELDILNIPLDDKETYDLLAAGDTTGVFQLESSGMRNILTRLKPERFSDVVALVALYRPGPLQSGMVDQYIKCKNGEIPIEYELEQLRPILEETYGVILYQEQVMQIASTLANYSLGEADILRRAMGKKIPEVMQAQRDRFLQGCRKNNISEEKANRIFDQMEKFALYGFNKSHSAAYAFIAYQTAYLKAHYPLEFMVALMNSVVSNTDKIVKLINECRKKGIEVLPPDINTSNSSFTISDGKIRFGLAAIKNIGEAAVKAIIENRNKHGSFSSIFDFIKRIDTQKVNKRIIEQLIKSGAFDSIHSNRAQLLNALDEIMNKTYSLYKQSKHRKNQKSIFDIINISNDSTFFSLAFQLPECPPWDNKLQLRYEKEALGFYVSSNPLQLYKDRLSRIYSVTSRDIENMPNTSTVVLVGMLSVESEKITKKGQKMGFLQLEDQEGIVNIVAFPEAYTVFKNLLATHEDEPLVVIGTIQSQTSQVDNDMPNEDENTEEDSNDNEEQQQPDFRKKFQIKVIAREFLTIDEAEQRQSVAGIILYIGLNTTTRDNLIKIREVITNNKGSCPVFFRITDDQRKYEVTIYAGDKYKVNPSSTVIENLKSILKGAPIGVVHTSIIENQSHSTDNLYTY